MTRILLLLSFLLISCAGLSPAQKTLLGLSFAECSSKALITAPMEAWVSGIMQTDPNWKEKLILGSSGAFSSELACVLKLIADRATMRAYLYGPTLYADNGSTFVDDLNKAAVVLNSIERGQTANKTYPTPTLVCKKLDESLKKFLHVLISNDATWFERLSRELEGPFSQDISCTMYAMAHEHNLDKMKATYLMCLPSPELCVTVGYRATYFIVDAVIKKRIIDAELPRNFFVRDPKRTN